MRAGEFPANDGKQEAQVAIDQHDLLRDVFLDAIHAEPADSRDFVDALDRVGTVRETTGVHNEIDPVAIVHGVGVQEVLLSKQNPRFFVRFPDGARFDAFGIFHVSFRKSPKTTVRLNQQNFTRLEIQQNGSGADLTPWAIGILGFLWGVVKRR